MTTTNRILLFFVLPILAILLFPPRTLLSGLPVIGVAVILFVILGIFLWRGRSNILTLSIFLQGLNVIIRLMMFYSNIIKVGEFDPLYGITNILGLALSMYLLLRLDRVDVRSTMVT